MERDVFSEIPAVCQLVVYIFVSIYLFVTIINILETLILSGYKSGYYSTHFLRKSRGNE